eukprot:326936-Prorocentrum_minimum.AAC.5
MAGRWAGAPQGRRSPIIIRLSLHRVGAREASLVRQTRLLSEPRLPDPGGEASMCPPISAVWPDAVRPEPEADGLRCAGATDGVRGRRPAAAQVQTLAGSFAQLFRGYHIKHATRNPLQLAYVFENTGDAVRFSLLFQVRVRRARGPLSVTARRPAGRHPIRRGAFAEPPARRPGLLGEPRPRSLPCARRRRVCGYSSDGPLVTGPPRCGSRGAACCAPRVAGPLRPPENRRRATRARWVASSRGTDARVFDAASPVSFEPSLEFGPTRWIMFPPPAPSAASLGSPSRRPAAFDVPAGDSPPGVGRRWA